VGKLADVTKKVGSGATPRGGKNSYHTQGTPLIRSLNIHFDRFLYAGLVYLNNAQASELDNVVVRAGDVLLNITGASIGRVNQCPFDLDGGRVNQHVCIIRPEVGLAPAFLRYFLSSPQQQNVIFQIESGVTRQALTKEMILNFDVPIAPLNEQRRIVAKIEELFSDLDAGVAALERIRANLKRYRAAVLKAAVEGRLTEEWRAKHPKTEPALKLLERILAERRQKWEEAQLAKFAAADKTPPKGWREKYVEPPAPDTSRLPGLPQDWCWATANQVCSQITDGEHIQPPYQDEGFPMLTATHVRNGQVEFNDVGYISESDFRRCLQRCAPTRGDVLIVSVGATTGRAGLVQECPPFALVRSVLMLKPIISGAFLLNWIQSPWCQSWIVRASGASAQAHFYISDTKRMPVPLAPHPELVEIVSEADCRISIVEEVEAQVNTNLKRAARLRQSILKRAFEGKLVPQDSTDEPAETLLNRIRLERSKMENGKRAKRRGETAK
jgi:type I restriction enzyme S subunit